MEFEDLYMIVAGLLQPQYECPGVENAFIPGSFCDREYEKVREAYLRICERLNCGDEDRDLDTILCSMEAIQGELCRRMWELGKRRL